MGEVLRRYWHPVGVSEWVTQKPQRLKLLGEELVVYRGASGTALMQLRCAHRSLALDKGRVEGDAIRCPYHGWLYDRSGQCLEQPAEPEGSGFKEKIRLRSFKVQEIGGLVFGYLGPEPAPLLPLYDTLTFEDGTKVIQRDAIECNWFQIVENIPDLAHLPWLHGGSFHIVSGKKITYRWETREYGFDNVMLIDGVADMHRSSYCFPYTNRFTVRPEKAGADPQRTLLYRVPIDDHATALYLVRTYRSAEPSFRTQSRGWKRDEYQLEPAAFWGIHPNDQDRMAVEQQGVITDRTTEHLGASDAGIIQMRQLMRQALKAVSEGRDPPFVIREPAKQHLRYEASLTSLSLGARAFA